MATKPKQPIIKPAPTGEDYDRVALIPEPIWREIRDAYVAGVDVTMISTRTRVPEHWIRQRAEREDWLSPQKREQIAMTYGLHRPEQLAQIKHDLSLAAAAVTAEKALEHRAMVANLAHGKLKDAQADLPAPRNWKEADIADRMARRAYGLEDGPSVQAVVQIGSLDNNNVEDVTDAIDV